MGNRTEKTNEQGEIELSEGVEAGQERRMSRRDILVVGTAGFLALAGVGYGVYNKIGSSNRDKRLKQEFFRYVPVTLDELVKNPEKYQAKTLGKSLGAVSPFTGEEIAGIELEFVPSEFVYEPPNPNEEGSWYRWVLSRDTLNPWEKISFGPEGVKTAKIYFDSYGKSEGLFGRVSGLFVKNELSKLLEKLKKEEPLTHIEHLQLQIIEHLEVQDYCEKWGIKPIWDNKRRIRIKGLGRTQYFDEKKGIQISSQILEIGLRRGESEKYKAMFAGFERAVIKDDRAIFYLSDDPYWDELRLNPGKDYEKLR